MMKSFISIRYAIMLSATALSLSGCIGIFEHQPPRHNFVAGSKRTPMLNPGGTSYQSPKVSEETEGTSDVAMTAPIMSESPSTIPQPITAGQAEPSPLYYYEQQNSQVQATELSSEETNALTTTSAKAQTSEKEVAQTSVASVVNAPKESAPTEYPKLQNVQKASPKLQETFDKAKEKASSFEAAYPVGVETSAPQIDVTKQPIAMPDAAEAEVVTPVAAPQAGVEKPEKRVTEFTPVYPAATPISTPAEEAMKPVNAPQATVAETSLGQAVTSAPALDPVAPIVEPSPLAQLPTPIAPAPQVSVNTSPAPIAPVALAAPSAPEPIIDALAPTPVAPPIPMQTYNPAENTVVVPSVAPVAAVGQIQRSEPIRLIAPPSMRGREIPASRYSNMRRNPNSVSRSY
jgi:hypothetical protein